MTSLVLLVAVTSLAAAAAQHDWYRDRRNSGYDGASASSNAYSGAGFVGSLNAFSGMGGYQPAYGVPGYGFQPPGFPGFDFNEMMEAHQRALQEFQLKAQAAHDAARSGFMGGGGDGVGASASGHFGPGGGEGTAQIYPGAPGGLDLRFGEGPGVGGPVNSVGGPIPASGGGTFGVFTSSSSGQSTVNGQTKSFKTATVGVNDNGRVKTWTAHDP